MIDDRGSIDFICDEPVGGIQRIYSRAGSTRSNHYHKTDWHILYVVSGEMHIYERPFNPLRVLMPVKIELFPGQWIKTGPMIEHTTKFPKDTILLCFSGSPRDSKSYENDVVRTQDLSAL